MNCTNKEQETCEVEKRGCKGCFYNDGSDKDVGSIADRMFEELGYGKIIEHKFKEPKNGKVTELILYRDGIKRIEIEFWNDKTISKIWGYDVSYITIQELQAINEKVKELGWNE